MHTKDDVTKDLTELAELATVPKAAFDEVANLTDDNLSSMKVSELADMCIGRAGLKP